MNLIAGGGVSFESKLYFGRRLAVICFERLLTTIDYHFMTNLTQCNVAELRWVKESELEDGLKRLC